MIQRAKYVVLGQILELGVLDMLYLAFCDSIRWFPILGYVTSLLECHKSAFWMIQRTEKVGVSHFQEFALLDQLKISYFNST